MLSTSDNVPAANVYHRATNSLGGVYYDVVVLRHMERIQCLDFFANPV